MKKAKKIIEGLSEEETKALLNEAIKELEKVRLCSDCSVTDFCGASHKLCKRQILDELAEKAGVIL